MILGRWWMLLGVMYLFLLKSEAQRWRDFLSCMRCLVSAVLPTTTLNDLARAMSASVLAERL